MLLDTSNSSSSLLPGSSSPHLSTNFDPLPLDPRSSNVSHSAAVAPIYGTAADDLIEVRLGNNTVFAGDGKNVVLTGLGNDMIYTGFGNDIIDAGEGRNTIFAGDGVNLVTTGLGNDWITSGAGGDFIDAGDGRNTVNAGSGNNRVLTGKGNDTVTTGAGNDTVYSGAGNDTINAGDGNNIINAGIGNDTVILGSGTDKIVLEAGQGSVTINGFNRDSDKLRLGASLQGQSITLVTQGSDTLVKSGEDVLATIKGVTSGSQNFIDSGPLYRYVATDLGSLSTNTNGTVSAASINDFGQIAGRYDTGATFTNTNATTGATQTNNVRQGFVWENGTMTAITSTGVKDGQSNDGAADGTTVTLLTPNVNTIGNRGQILGTGDEVRQPIPKPTDRGLVWTPNSRGSYDLVINDFGGVESYVFDINNRNQIPGRNIDSPDHETPIYFENVAVTQLTDLGGGGGTARGINSKGQIVGFVDSDGLVNGVEENTAVIWEKDANGVYQLTNLGTFGADQATLRDINGAGQIIGSTTNGTGSTATSTPFIYQDGAFISLGSLGGNTGSSNGLNEFGEVVGASQIASGANHGYVYIGGKLTDLNDLVTTPLTYNGAAVTLTSAVSINNFGEIVATGTYTYKDPVTGLDKTGTRSYRLQTA
jgi:probable HAF family extracellular repeat protein